MLKSLKGKNNYFQKVMPKQFNICMGRQTKTRHKQKPLYHLYRDLAPGGLQT